MKYDRSKLLAAAVQAVKAGEQAHVARYVRELRDWEAKRDAWAERYASAWEAAGRKIAIKARKGLVVTLEDLPAVSGLGYRSAATFETSAPKEQDYDTPNELRILIAALNAFGEETVTSAALRELGVTGSTLGRAMQFIQRGSVQS